MKRAAALNVVDFSKAKLLDRNWWKYVGWMLAELENRDHLRLLEVRSIVQATVITAINDSGKLSEASKLLDEYTNNCAALSFPWAHKFENKAETNKAARDRWVNTYGDPNSPETKEKIKRTQEHLRSMRNKSRLTKEEGEKRLKKAQDRKRRRK